MSRKLNAPAYLSVLTDRNLVFVDEGHRGASGEAWRKVRDAVAARAFTFECSATFGQALAAAQFNRLTFDPPELTDRLLLGNLLSFHEQLRACGDNAVALRDYNLEPPFPTEATSWRTPTSRLTRAA